MKETIYFAGGCFWGAQRFFDQFEGVVSTEVGYANGPTKDPTYEEVCNDRHPPNPGEWAGGGTIA